MADQFDPVANQLVQVLVTVALTLLMGIEREEKAHAENSYMMAGVRTFPIIGLLGYAMAVLSPDSAAAIAVGFAALSAFLVVSYLHKLKDAHHGATTEMAVLAAYMVGALVARQHLAIAASVSVATVLLLQAKTPLEQFAIKLPRAEVATFAKFLILSAVILPVLPDKPFTQFGLNPFKTWLIVVAVSGISYASYVVQRLLRGRQSVLLTALLGGAYSSTLTTVVLAKRSKDGQQPALYAGAIVMASGVMYLRLAILLWIFNADLGWRLGPRLLVLAAVGGLGGYLLTVLSRGPAPAAPTPGEAENRNPLEVSTALIFAAMFLGISVVTQLAAQYLGSTGVYALAAVMGVADVDPFILSLTQTAGQTTALLVAAVAVVIAAASNNVVKGIYALVFGERRTGRLALAGLVALGAASLLAMLNL